ncbi:unnamed protein product [Rotaria sp. Silwood1]|nr:unnamed protein product [Rotaria sp. Silwood1]CAF0950757.1 unnamed protein product [Rotaria sp. Silwood1]CAF3397170.1 unnamed protein product [Rotaria sp. Silwood1]CAF4504945.1 unnamed protein product [Rotaria sp. Silwood1]
MVYFCIRAHCLAQQQEWKKDYEDISGLKKDIYDHFQVYNINEESSVIVYYDEKEKCDRRLDNLDILLKDDNTIFDVYVKRIWACCGVCFGPFDIIPDRLPLECTEKLCNVQCCVKCVDIICELNKNRKFTCMFCNKTGDRPKRNILLENIFLWKPYTIRYGAHSTERIETIFNAPNLSDAIHRIENRRTHIQTLQTTLKMRLSTLTETDSHSDKSTYYLIAADQLSGKLETFITRLRICERNIISQSVSFRTLVNNYRKLLRDSICQKSSKQEAASFILICEKLSASDYENIERMMTMNEQLIITESNLISIYNANKLKDITVKESIACVTDILEDIVYRRSILQEKQQQVADLYLNSINHPFHTYYVHQHQNATTMITSLDEYEIKFIYFRDIYNEIDSIMHEYKDELTKKTLDDTSNEHTSLPTSEQMATFQCSRLILISELLRSETDQIEIETIFPRITKQVQQWQQSQVNDPKIYDLFATLEQDLLSLYDPNHSLLHLIPFRVGFIGNISVGKSSLVNYLRTQNSISTSTNRTLSPTAVGQSTVGSLQFDEQHLCSKTQTVVTIRYVDIEGCADFSAKVKAASYFEQIQKADCDLYIILYTGQQVSFERKLEKEIKERLNRPCWYVRSKVDIEFEEHFNEKIRRRKLDYPDITIEDNEENEFAEQVVEIIREKAIEICQTSSDKVFLINSLYSNTEENNKDKINSKTHPFDIHLLSQQLINAAQQSYTQERIKRMAAMTCARIIGTCFRRRCITSFISHEFLASVSAILVPWGDQIALAHTRFGIRTALGVQDRPSLYNQLMKKVDEFESLLLKYPLNIDPMDLKSDAFNYLKTTDSTTMTGIIHNKNEYSETLHLGREPKTNSSIARKLTSAMPTGVYACGLVGKKIAATLAIGSLSYGVGVGFLGLGIVAAIPIGLWASKTSGKEIRDYLDSLCADLLIISEHFIVAIINQQEFNRE